MDIPPPPRPPLPPDGQPGSGRTGASDAPPPGAYWPPAAAPPSYGSWPGAGTPGRVPAGRSGMATAAMVLGIVGIVLCFVVVPSILALIFGLIAASSIRTSQAAGRPIAGAAMARAGWILGLIGLVAGIVFIVIAVATDDREDGTSLRNLRPGDCVELGSVGDEEELSGLPRVACSEPHDAEVFHVDSLEGAQYPGTTRVVEQVEAACLAAFEPYVGTPFDESELGYSSIYPVEASWRVHKGYVCLVSTGGTLTESLRGSGR